MNIAYAMGSQGAAGQGGSQWMSFLPLILLFVVFYFLLIRPQQKRAKQQKQFLENLKKGDDVITSGGLYGKITGLTDSCLLYTSDAADDPLCVDLGGRRTLKKKKHITFLQQ